MLRWVWSRSDFFFWFHSNFYSLYKIMSLATLKKVIVWSISWHAKVANTETKEIHVLILDHSSFCKLFLDGNLLSSASDFLPWWSICSKTSPYSSHQRKRKQVNFTLKRLLGAKAGRMWKNIGLNCFKSGF